MEYRCFFLLGIWEVTFSGSLKEIYERIAQPTCPHRLVSPFQFSVSDVVRGRLTLRSFLLYTIKKVGNKYLLGKESKQE